MPAIVPHPAASSTWGAPSLDPVDTAWPEPVSAGAGIGRARVNFAGERDANWAGQLIAGARFAVTPNVDIGLKYRHLRTRKLGLTTVAEGVETPEQRGILRDEGCHELQGYLFSRPMPLEQVAAVEPGRDDLAHGEVMRRVHADIA